MSDLLYVMPRFSDTLQLRAAYRAEVGRLRRTAAACQGEMARLEGLIRDLAGTRDADGRRLRKQLMGARQAYAAFAEGIGLALATEVVIAAEDFPYVETAPLAPGAIIYGAGECSPRRAGAVPDADEHVRAGFSAMKDWVEQHAQGASPAAGTVPMAPETGVNDGSARRARGSGTVPEAAVPEGGCSVPGCPHGRVAIGLCANHYRRERDYGEAALVKRMVDGHYRLVREKADRTFDVLSEAEAAAVLGRRRTGGGHA